ncbi:MAG: membrane dipeptidase [Pseudomonadota bacterium]
MHLRTRYLVITATLFIALMLFFTWLPVYIEQSRNRVQTKSLATISKQSKQLHQSLFIADLHADSLLWDRNLSRKSNYGHVDIPRLIEGNIGLQVFSVVTKTPKNLNLYKNSDRTDNITLLALAQLWPPNTWFSLFERAQYQAKKLHRAAHKSKQFFHIIKSQNDLKQYLQKRKDNNLITSGLLSLEGAHALEGNIKNLDRLFDSGYRIIGFSHFFDNELGGSAHGMLKSGITEFGKQVLQRIHELEMFVDVSHASPKLINDIVFLSKRPVLATHTGIQSVCSSKSHRNLKDAQIVKIANTGGLIGIGFWPTSTCGKGVIGIIDSIRYVIDLVGIEHVALGSDFDGNVSVPFSAKDISQITHALLQTGFNHGQIEKIMGGNIKNLLLRYLPAQ